MSLDANARCIIIDCGTENTKAGFKGEHFPRCITPTIAGGHRHKGFVGCGIPEIYFGEEARLNRGTSNLLKPVQNGVIVDWPTIELLWHYIFYQELREPPEQCHVLYSVNPLLPDSDIEKIAEIFFESFAVKALFLCKSPSLSLYACGKTSGVVWESGAGSAYAAPVYEGFAMPFSMETSPLTGDKMTEILQQMILKAGYSFFTNYEMDVLQRIKAELCYVSKDYDDEIKFISEEGEAKVEYTLPDGQVIYIGKSRFVCPETQFQPKLNGLNCLSVADTIRKSISKCDYDIRSLLYKNIVVAGGSSRFPGFSERLLMDLQRKGKLVEDYKVNIDSLDKKHLATWIGGSIMASLDNLKGFWMTQDDYADQGASRIRHYCF